MKFTVVLFSFSLKAIIFEIIFFNVSYTYETYDLEKNFSVIDNNFFIHEINKSFEIISTNNEQQSIIHDTHSPSEVDIKNISSKSTYPSTYLRGYTPELNRNKNNFTVLTNNISELVSLNVQNIKNSQFSTLDNETAIFCNYTPESSLQGVKSGLLAKSHSKKACDLNFLINTTAQNETNHYTNHSSPPDVEKQQPTLEVEMAPVIDLPQKINFTAIDSQQEKYENYQELLNDPVFVQDFTESVLSLTRNVLQPRINHNSTKKVNALQNDSDKFTEVPLRDTNEQFVQQLNKFSKQSDDLLERMKTLPEPTFRSIGRDIPEKECYALCVLDNQCLSYRWTSYNNHCEFVYPTKKSCSEINSSISEQVKCLMNPAIEAKNAEVSLKRLSTLPLNEQRFSESVKENSGMPYETQNGNIPKKTHGPVLLPHYNEMSALNSHKEKLASESESHQPSGVKGMISPQMDLESNYSVESMDESNNEFLRHAKKQEQYTGVLPRVPLLQNTLLGGGLTRLIPGMVPATLQSSLRIQEDIPTMMQGAANAIKTLQSVLAAGDTVMKTFPVADLIRTTQTLSSNGFLKVGHAGGIKGGVPAGVKDKAKGATRPPRGVESPEVFCYPQGMRCCIPQGAASKYKKDPPMLNGVNTQECTAHYISNINKLCVTIMYEENRCNQAVIVTETAKVYRNVMIIPDKTMNNAICECILPKMSETVTEKDQNHIIPASARWQYSRNAQEKELETKQRFHDTVKKLSNAAKTMFLVSDIVTKPYADTESRSMSEGAASFIETLSQLGDDLQQKTRALSTIKKST